MTGYTRNDTSNNIANDKVINADDLDGEFDAIEVAFDSTSGHTHDGTAAEGGPILVLGPVQDVVATATTLEPKTTNTLDLGTTLKKWKDGYLSGNIDVAGNAVVGGTLGVIGVTTLADLDTTTLDVTGATGLQNVTVSGTLGVTGTSTLSVTNTGALGVTGNITVSGTVDGRDVATDGSKLDTIETNADVTDTVNVTAAGALMDSELTNITAVKTLNQGVSTADSPTFLNPTVAGSLDVTGSGTFGDLFLGPGGTGGPHVVQFYDSVGNLGHKIAYRTTPDTLAVELGNDTPVITFENNGDVTVEASLSVGSLLNMTNGIITNADEIQLSDGGTSDPSVTFTNDQNSGLYSFSNGILGFTTNGVESYTMQSGTTAPRSSTVISREKGDERYARQGQGLIGSLAFAINNSGSNIAYGSTVSGSSLNVSGINTAGVTSSGGTLSGTWRCLGDGDTGHSTLWQRVS